MIRSTSGCSGLAAVQRTLASPNLSEVRLGLLGAQATPATPYSAMPITLLRAARRDDLPLVLREKLARAAAAARIRCQPDLTWPNYAGLPPSVLGVVIDYYLLKISERWVLVGLDILEQVSSEERAACIKAWPNLIGDLHWLARRAASHSLAESGDECHPDVGTRALALLARHGAVV